MSLARKPVKRMPTRKLWNHTVDMKEEEGVFVVKRKEREGT